MWQNLTYACYWERNAVAAICAQETDLKTQCWLWNLNISAVENNSILGI